MLGKAANFPSERYISFFTLPMMPLSDTRPSVIGVWPRPLFPGRTCGSALVQTTNFETVLVNHHLLMLSSSVTTRDETHVIDVCAAAATLNVAQLPGC